MSSVPVPHLPAEPESCRDQQGHAHLCVPSAAGGRPSMRVCGALWRAAASLQQTQPGKGCDFRGGGRDLVRAGSKPGSGASDEADTSLLGWRECPAPTSGTSQGFQPGPTLTIENGPRWHQEGDPQEGLHVHLTSPGESLPSTWDFTVEPPGSPLMSHNPRSQAFRKPKGKNWGVHCPKDRGTRWCPLWSGSGGPWQPLHFCAQ